MSLLLRAVVLAWVTTVCVGSFNATECLLVSCGDVLSLSTENAVHHLGYPSNDMLLHFSLVNASLVTLSTCDSDFDTVVRVYTSNLDTEVAVCDDCGLCGVQASLQVNLTQGDYVVVVEGFLAESGTFNLAVTCDPTNPTPTPSPPSSGCSISPTPMPTTCSPTSMQALIDSLVGSGSGYDANTRPGVAINDGLSSNDVPPDTVELQLTITKIETVDMAARTILLFGYLDAYWYDPRLKFSDTTNGGCFDQLTIPSNMWSKFWQPDVYIENMVDNMKVIASGVMIFADGLQQRSMLISAKLSCDMKFSDFPFDEQLCDAELSTYTYSAADVYLTFFNNESVVLFEDLSHIEYDISVGSSDPDIDINTYVFEFGVTWRNTHHRFKLKRKPGFYNKHMVATSLLVFIAWTGFFIDRTATPARVALSIVTVLSTTTLFFGIAYLLPKTTGFSWLEKFIFGGLVWNTVAVVEYAAISFLLTHEREAQAAKPKDVPMVELGSSKSEEKSAAAKKPMKARMAAYWQKLFQARLSRKIDEFFRWAFLTSFLTFVLVLVFTK